MMPLENWSKICIGWSAVIVGGIYSFYLARVSVDKRRYENMKIRERMRHANAGEYEDSYRKFSTVDSSAQKA